MDTLIFTTLELVPLIRDTITLFGTTLVRSLFTELKIVHMISTGTPRGNNQVERYVATLINMLNTTCNGSSDWPSGMWKVQQSITVQKSTGFAPIRLLIVVNANIPSVQARLSDVSVPGSSIDLRADRELVTRRLQVEAERFKNLFQFDSVRRDDVSFDVGNLVYVIQEHRCRDKLICKFKGPYKIMALLLNDRYSLQGQGLFTKYCGMENGRMP